jgi:hypothetical protein
MILGEGKESPRSAPSMVSGVSLEERRTVVPLMPAHQRRATWVHRRDCGRDPGVVRVVIARTGVHSAGRASNPFYDCLGRSRIVVPTVGRWQAGPARLWQVLLRATQVWRRRIVIEQMAKEIRVREVTLSVAQQVRAACARLCSLVRSGNAVARP